MSQHERTGRRPGEFSAFHRTQSLKRFCGLDQAQRASMIDVDAVATVFLEMRQEDKAPLVLMEVFKMTSGRPRKSATAIERLARQAGVPAYMVGYEVAERPNPADPNHRDIERFHVKRLTPKPDRDWRVLAPHQFAHGLLNVREWMARRIEVQQAANDDVY